MTLTAQALLSLSFLACAPLQQASIFVAEEVQIVVFTEIMTIETNWSERHVVNVLFTSLFLLFKLPLRPVAFVFCLEPRSCILETNIVSLWRPPWWKLPKKKKTPSPGLTQFVFALLKSILRGVQRPRMPDKYFGAATDGKDMFGSCEIFVLLLILQISVLTVPFCIHLASNPDVEPTLPLHRRALLSSAARWLDTRLYIWKNSSSTMTEQVGFFLFFSLSTMFLMSLPRQRIWVTRREYYSKVKFSVPVLDEKHFQVYVKKKTKLNKIEMLFLMLIQINWKLAMKWKDGGLIGQN